jgi:hypothetical protein
MAGGLSPDDRVPDDRPCLVCGYNLRSIAVSGHCPECGTPVERSLRGILLRYSAPDYVAMLRRGITLVEASLFLQIVVGIVGVVVMFAIMGLGAKAAASAPAPPGGKPAAPGFAGPGLAYEMAKQGAEALVKLLTLGGWWMFSTPDPALTTQDPAYRSRRLLRVFLAISAAFSLASVIVGMFPALRAPLMPGPAVPAGMASAITYVAILGLLGGGAQLLGFIFSMNYMAHLSRRIPDAAMEKQAKMYRWLLPVIYVFGMVVCVGPLAAFIMYVVQIDTWRRRLRDLTRAVMQDDVAVRSV